MVKSGSLKKLLNVGGNLFMDVIPHHTISDLYRTLGLTVDPEMKREIIVEHLPIETIGARY